MPYDQLLRDIAREDFERHRNAWAAVAKVVGDTMTDLALVLDAIGVEDAREAGQRLDAALSHSELLRRWREAVR